MRCGRCHAPVFDEDGVWVHGEMVGRACIQGIVTPVTLPNPHGAGNVSD